MISHPVHTTAEKFSAQQITPQPVPVPPGAVLTAEQVVELLRKGGPLHLEGRSIQGSINLRNVFVPDAVTFHLCDFEGEFDATNARFGRTLTLTKCTFGKSLTLRGAQIGGTFNIQESIVKLPHDAEFIKGDESGSRRPNRITMLYEPPPDARSAKWDGLTILGGMNASRLTVHGSLNLGDAEIRGSVLFHGIDVGSAESSGFDHGRLYMRQARVDGDVELSPWTDPDDRAAAPRRTCIWASLSIGSSVIKGRLNLRGAQIEGCLHAIMAEISGRVLADCWVHPDDYTVVRRTEIGLVTHTTDSAAGNQTDPAVLKKLSIHFQDTKIGSSVWLGGIKTEGGADFDNAEIGGSLDLRAWSPAVKEEAEAARKSWTEVLGVSDASPARKEDSAEVGSVIVYQTNIGPSHSNECLGFRNARIEANIHLEGVWARGRIVGHNANVRGNILCVPYELRGLQCYVRPRVENNRDGKSLSLYGITVGGNVEFSGATFTGSVRLRHAVVSGAIIGQPWRFTNPDGTPTQVFSNIGMGREQHGLYLYGTQVAGNVCCNHLEIKGSLALKLAKVGGSVEFKNAGIALECRTKQGAESGMPGVSLEDAKVDGDAEFSECRIGSGFDAASMVLGGSLDFTKTHFQETPESTYGDARGRIAGNLGERHGRGLVCLRGASIKGHVNAPEMKTSSWVDARGMSAAVFNLTNARIGRWGLLQKPAVLSLAESNIPGCLILRHCRAVSAIDSGSPPHAHKGAAEADEAGPGHVDLGHARIGAIEIEEPHPRLTFNLVGIAFNHLEVTYKSAKIPWYRNFGVEYSSAGDLGRRLRKMVRPSKTDRRLRSLCLGTVTFLAFLWLLNSLALGDKLPATDTWLDPLQLLEHIVTTLLWGLSTLIWAIAYIAQGIVILLWDTLKWLSIAVLPPKLQRLPGAEEFFHNIAWWPQPAEDARFWTIFYGSAVFVCGWFLFRNIIIVKPSLHRWKSAELKGWEYALFLNKTVKFSQEPYHAVRRMLEANGEDEEARALYYLMRARELKEGEMSRFTTVMKWVFFIAAGSGVRVFTLCCFLVLYFCFSWLAVFSNPDSVEHPSTFKTERTVSSGKAAAVEHPAHETTEKNSGSDDVWHERTGKAPGEAWQDFKTGDGTWPYYHAEMEAAEKKKEAEPWTLQDGFWMAVKVHVPLIHLWAKEKWEPAAIPGWYYSPSPREQEGINPHMRPMWWGMEYETYAVIAQIISYLTIPMLITAIGGFYKSDPASHGHHHAHSHSEGHGGHHG